MRLFLITLTSLLIIGYAKAEANKDRGMLNFEQAFMQTTIKLCGKDVLTTCPHNIAPSNLKIYKSFSCLKRDGDWLDGVNKKQCKALGGEWRGQK